MIFGQDRNELRQMYVDAWQKTLDGSVLSPLEAQISKAISDHPEYQEILAGDKLDGDYTPEEGETNPFLHMGLHLAIREQLATDRPAGIAAIFERLAHRTGDRHQAEHLAIDCLAETLWEAQSHNALPDEAAYFERLQRL